ncbi:class I adenylate-forming enzyme family protein [Actinomadura sp. 7K507]|uniref:class I adenylate-forming enzyme family protein n=1 Tax=Actinomadura sp. 7K507 TaxID=2530365 RepID=UPI00104478EA|nr:class I adenylate-forming enzyme family protein [Actinomadura sp. 7K507]TDC90231.1 long-chain fatty acid--CoA ligase [Actinomadura sp. 7K507]
MTVDQKPTIPTALASLTDRCPNRDALVTATERITWTELDVRSRGLAAVLADRGVTRRTRVGLLMENGIDWAVHAFAIMRMGAVLVPLSTFLRAPELDQQLRTAAVERLILVDGFRDRNFLDEFKDLLPLGARDGRTPRLPALRSAWRHDELRDAPPSSEKASALEDRVRPADDLAIMFTSGSRGTPKGVIHTHGNALRAVAASLPIRCVRPGDRLYIPMPFFWMGGFGGGLLTVLAAGATLLTEAVPSPESTLELLSRERATLFRGWPDQAARLAAHPLAAETDLSSLRPGSLPAILPPHLRSHPGARANLFGMTETFGPYCGDPLDQDMRPEAWGSCGTPFPGMQVRIATPETGEPTPSGEHGEIQVRGRHLMRGICGRSREEVFTKDGWCRTGDIGHLDDAGRLWHHGRLDDMLKIRGATVYPTEVESALQTIPGIHQAFVTDVPAPDGTPQIAAAVIPEPDTALDEADVLKAARTQLSAFKLPTVLRVLPPGEDVPRLPTGKPNKPALQRLLTE